MTEEELYKEIIDSGSWIAIDGGAKTVTGLFGTIEAKRPTLQEMWDAWLEYKESQRIP